MSEITKYTVTCSGAKPQKKKGKPHYRELEYREKYNNQNVIIKLNDFVTKNYHLTDRYKDLLEIAGYVFAADRTTYRGKDNAIELHKWSRAFDFHIKVRDKKFWSDPETKTLLAEALEFVTGDHKYEFTFYQAEPDFPTSLFDSEKFIINKQKKISTVLYSGGLDSLAGVVDRLETTTDELCLISHQSGQPGVIRTQNKLFEGLDNIYPNRCKHYKFRCGLTGTPTKDESQRSRVFLYASIAFAVANNTGQSCIYVYENGITSINFAHTQDLMNGRASRTTHPKTIGLLEKLFTKIAGKEFKIHNPFLFKTKTDVVDIIKGYKKCSLIDSTVSCSHTRESKTATHCGKCLQCVDRIFAMHAAGIEKYDHGGLYLQRFYNEPFEENEPLIKTIVDYITLAQQFADEDINAFYMNRGSEVLEIEQYLEGETELERIQKIYDLCQRHSKQIDLSIGKMRESYDKALGKPNPKSFYKVIVDPREYQRWDRKELEEIKKGNEIVELKTVPPRRLKKLAIDACQNLIADKTIKKILVETKKDKCISSLIAAELRKEYKLTHSNENSISDYYRKFELQIIKKDDELIVRDNYKRKQ